MSEDKITVGGRCVFCGGSHAIEVPFEGYLLWEQGELVQKAFPNMGSDDREFLISGICPACQAKFFK
jgi:hypothetical protein